jgi:hypothetical protein
MYGGNIMSKKVYLGVAKLAFGENLVVITA